MSSQSCSGASAAGAIRISPALFTTVSSRPSSATVRCTAADTCSASATSAGTTSAVPPADSISDLSSCRRSARRASSATAAPWAASALAVAAPIPLLAPVTSATLSANVGVMLCLPLVNGAQDFMQHIVGVFAQVGCAARNSGRVPRHAPRRSQYRTLAFAVIGDEAIQLPIPELLIANDIDRRGALAGRYADRPQAVRELLGVVVRVRRARSTSSCSVCSRRCASVA